MKIDVLGTKYNLRRVNFDQDEFMRKMNYGGYCDNNTKEIVILNLKSTPGLGLGSGRGHSAHGEVYHSA